MDGGCRRHSYGRPPPKPRIPDADLPFVTILRPIKGCDPNLTLCLASTCLIDYPRDKLELVYSVASPADAAIPVIGRVLARYPDVNAKCEISEEDVGPNPKIRNLSKAYREATGDVVWILDCNVWVAPGTLRRSVELLEGTDGRPGHKLVHHLPIAVDITETPQPLAGADGSPPSPPGGPSSARPGGGPVPAQKGCRWLAGVVSYGGGRLEENFLSSSHAKFYSAVNTLTMAPCVVGKSELFRRSHLDEVTGGGGRNAGLSFFADYICEDHMIAAKLWHTPLQEELSGRRKWRKHGMGSDIVFQPLSDMSVSEYTARRIRWISVRKYTELVATLCETTTESGTMSLIAAYGATAVPGASRWIGPSWASFGWVFVSSIAVWATFDRHIFNYLHSYRSTAVDENSPPFIASRAGRPFREWLLQWLGREVLAPYVWVRSLLPGPIAWRGGIYRIRWSDKKVVEISRASNDKRRD